MSVKCELEKRIVEKDGKMYKNYVAVIDGKRVPIAPTKYSYVALDILVPEEHK